MKRTLDILLSAILIAALSPLMLVIGVLVRATSPGPALHFSTRVGKGQKSFRMPKFRTMRTDTPQVATHLLTEPERWITPVGRWLRRSSLDELPQLGSILIGQMSFVGPRPALINQTDLITLREASGVNSLPPGLTGWAQVNGRDELPIAEKVARDVEYLKGHSLGMDLWILAATVRAAVFARGVREGAGPEVRRVA